MRYGSLCALGGFTPFPVMSALNHYPEDFSRRPPRGAPKPRNRRPEERPMALVHEIDYGTPALEVGAAGHAYDRRHAGQRAGGHLDHARRDGGRDADPKTLLDRHARRLRLLPALPGRDRGPRRNAGLLHDAGRAGHGRPHPDRPARPHPPRRDGALYLRPSARLPDLCRQRRLRIAGHGRRRGPARRALRLCRREPVFAKSNGTPNAA